MPLSYLRRPLFIALAGYMLILGGLRAFGAFDAWIPLERLSWLGKTVRLEARVVSPRRRDLRGVKFVLDEARVRGDPAGARVLAYLPPELSGIEALFPGRRAVFTGVLRLPRSPRNPGEFDERRFLWDRGIGWLMSVAAVEPERGPVPWRWRPAFWAERARLSVQESFARAFEPDDARLLTALTLGYKEPLPRALNRAVQDSGAMHLLVPSGAKVAFVLLAVSWAAGALGLPLAARLAAAAGLGGFYTLMVGGDPPYARAYLGALALGLGAVADRESGAFQAAVLSAWLILLFEPRALFSAGFQMTYLAMAGLLVAMPRFDAALPDSWPRPARWLACVLAVTLIVQLMLWPLFANLFGRAAALGASANLLLVPLSGVILASGFFFWGLRLLASPAAVLAVPTIVRLLSVFKAVCFTAASLPFAATELCPMGWPLVLTYYLAATAILVLPRRRIAAVLAAAALAIFLASAAAASSKTAPLRVVYLSLPAEDCAVAVRRGETWIIGRPVSPARKALKAMGFLRIDHVAEPRGFSLCEGLVCFSFEPPRATRGAEEFSIISPRPGAASVAASTDGFRIEIKDPFPRRRAFHQLGRHPL